MRLPDSADVVVIGGGVVGCSIAYHLAKAGRSSTVLLEREKLSAGTTWHSAGNMETYRNDPVLFEMVRYGVSLYPELERESGQATGWRTRGRVYYTGHSARQQHYRHVPKLAAARGIAVEYVDPAEIKRLLPIIDTPGILGGLWVPEDGSVNPTDLTTAFARAAKKAGASVHEHANVTGLRVHKGEIVGVDAGEHHIKCGQVVLAAGAWSNDIASSCGVRLPLYAVQHFYIITEPIEDLPRDLPMFLAFEDRLYGREEVGGLLVGCLDSDALPIATSELPERFAFGLLDERWDQFEPYLVTATERFPVLQEARIKQFLNGPESFTPDGEMLLGPVSEVEGLFVATGMNSSGIALASGVGWQLAEWMTAGRPSLDTSRLDVRRFSSVQASKAFMRERVTEVVSYIASMHPMGEDYQTSRNIRQTPLHFHLAERGAHFASACGWERPLWFRSCDGKSWEDHVSAELNRLEQSVLLVDRSSDVKISIEGGGSKAFIRSLLGGGSTPEACSVSTHLITDDSLAVQAVVALLGAGPDSWLLIATAEQESFIRALLRKRSTRARSCVVHDVTARYGCLRILGPGRRRLLERCAECNGPSWSSSASEAVRCWIGSALALTWIDPWTPSLFVTCGAEQAVHVAKQLEAVEAAGWGGFLAEEAFRIRAGSPAFGREVSPSVRVRVDGLSLSGVKSKGHQPCPHRAIRGYVSRRLAIDGMEPVFHTAHPVGWVTSSAWFPSVGKSYVFARVAAHCADESLEVLCGDELVPLSPLSSDEAASMSVGDPPLTALS